MLQNDFYQIKTFQHQTPLINTEIEINVTHKIFEGHFANQPVVPGVCMMQMVKEILEHAIEKKINLQQSDEMKFLTIINPKENNIVDIEIKYTLEENKIKAVASLKKKDLIYFKFKGLFAYQ